MSDSSSEKKNDNNAVSDTEASSSSQGAFEDNKSTEFQEQLKKLAEEKDKYYQSYLRALADQENSKKRYQKEKEDSLKYSNEKLFKEFLPVLDAVEKASKEIDGKQDDHEQVTAIKTGFDLIAKQLQDVLKKHGLKEISCDDSLYDPNLHQAVQTEENDSVDVATINEEFIKGYELNGRLLRPSMVSVFLPQNSEES